LHGKAHDRRVTRAHCLATPRAAVPTPITNRTIGRHNASCAFGTPIGKLSVPPLAPLGAPDSLPIRAAPAARRRTRRGRQRPGDRPPQRLLCLRHPDRQAIGATRATTSKTRPRQPAIHSPQLPRNNRHNPQCRFNTTPKTADPCP
jgi:hypothetical protein